MIINALVMDSSGINLAQAHDQLKTLLENRFDKHKWGNLLDHMDCVPGEEPIMTVDEAFQFAALPEVRHSDYKLFMEEYRNASAMFL